MEYKADSFVAHVARIIRKGVFSSSVQGDAVSLFLGDDESPGDLRLVYQKGLYYPESMYGMLSRSRVQRYSNDDGNNVGPNGTHFQLYSFTGRWSSPDRFFTPSLAVREEFVCRIRKLWTRDGLPGVLLFIDFRRLVDEMSLEELSFRETLNTMYVDLEKALDEYAKSANASRVRELSRVSDRLGAKLFFESRDFDFDKMTRYERDEVLERLITRTIAEYFPGSQHWWLLYAPATSQELEVKELRLVRNYSHENLKAPSLLRLSDPNIESWVFSCDCPLRFRKLGHAKKASRFSRLLRGSYLNDVPDMESLICIPITSGNTVFAVATIGMGAGTSQDLSAFAEGITNVLRSLWVNGRRVAQFWRHSFEGRGNSFSSRILDTLRESVGGNAAVIESQARRLQGVLTDQLQATACTLWRWDKRTESFHRIASGKNANDPDRPRGTEGWTYKVLLESMPYLFQRNDIGSPIDIYRWQIGEFAWERVTSGPDFRSPASRRQWLTQLALPLRWTRKDTKSFGVAWVFWDVEKARQPRPEEIDPEWVSRCTDDVALTLQTLTEYIESAREEAESRMFLVMRALRHDVLSKIPTIIKAEVLSFSSAAEFEAKKSDIIQAADILYTVLNYYTSFYLDGERGFHAGLRHTGKCDARQVIALARRYASMIIEEQPDILIKEDVTSCEIAMDKEALTLAMFNLLLNAKSYLKDRAAPDRYAPILVEIRHEGNFVTQIVVDDCGRGMKPDQIARAGKREFNQSGSHLGIGLLLTAWLIRSAGKLTFVSPNERGGTTVTLEFNTQLEIQL